MRKIITAQEFEEQYAQRANLTIEQLHELGQFIFPCHCGYSDCRGWQIRNPKTFNDYEINRMPDEYRLKAIKYLLENCK